MLQQLSKAAGVDADDRDRVDVFLCYSWGDEYLIDRLYDELVAVLTVAVRWVAPVY